jgi:calcineurin-like phosphoesterase family protein
LDHQQTNPESILVVVQSYVINAFYSDPHFGHANIIKLAGRPFSSTKRMDAELIRRYNDKIGMNDVVLWLGDAFLCPIDRAKEIMRQLNGIKLLVLGNHDRTIKVMTEIGFSLVMDTASLNIDGRSCRFCHFPYAGVIHAHGVDDRFKERRLVKRRNEILIHGHTHVNKKVTNNMINVGCDANDFAPVLYDELIQLMQKHFPHPA